jgi:TetR/AcrR family transcriptional regulator, repressor for neighboring sulfatase
VRVAGALAIVGRPVGPGARFNPVQAMASTLEEGYGLDSRSARLRAAQIMAAALGWRIFEDYLVQAGGLDAVPLATLRDELAQSGRRLGATPWPSPPDPRPEEPPNPRVPGLRTVAPEYHRPA